MEQSNKAPNGQGEVIYQHDDDTALALVEAMQFLVGEDRGLHPYCTARSSVIFEPRVAPSMPYALNIFELAFAGSPGNNQKLTAHWRYTSLKSNAQHRPLVLASLAID